MGTLSDPPATSLAHLHSPCPLQAKWDLQQQATNLAELRKGAEESERREKALTEAEHALQVQRVQRINRGPD